jgi:hypothetical protein
LYGFDISHDLTYDVMHTLALCVFKKFVHMLVKYVARNGKIKDLDGALQTVKKLSPATLGARWPRSTKSLGFYKVEEYQIFVMWCLPHVLDHLNLGLDSILGGIGVVLTEVGRLKNCWQHGVCTWRKVLGPTHLCWSMLQVFILGPFFLGYLELR